MYSHTNYALLELIAEKVTGKSFDDAIRVAILFTTVYG
ncbi:MAG: serine hydrolase [Saprospiraceae bacterium]|nr:serine hydrolase [Saprospiraceae bacterium]